LIRDNMRKWSQWSHLFKISDLSYYCNLKD
jgi:hypothetical protein